MENSLERRVTDIEGSLAKAHRTGIETGATLIMIVRIICDAIPAAIPGIERGLLTALDAMKQSGGPVAQALLEGALKAARGQGAPTCE